MRSRSLASCGVALVLAAAALVAQAPDQARTESLSRRATERLQSLHEEADRLAAEERSLLTNLRRLEVEREIRAVELERSRDAVKAASAELAALDRQLGTLTEQSNAALPDLQARLVTLYKLGRGRYARLLLSASDLRQFAQAVRMVSALAEQDRQHVVEYRDRLAAMTSARSAARDRQVQVRRLQLDAERARAESERAVEAHNALVHEIDTRRDLNAQYYGDLMLAQQRLQASLSGLVATDTASLPIDPFKGTLEWPVDGRLRPRVSDSSGRPALAGIEITTAENTGVRAVHDGVVAYADVFAGFGRLVIVDHGSGTFTLYGNLGSIQAAKGMRVERGSPIGTVGLTADGTAALYFELRVDGRAVDPLQWLTKR